MYFLATMSTEILEGRVEEKEGERVKTRQILPCVNQVFVPHEYLEIKDVGDHLGKSVIRIMKNPSINYKTNCSGCINDEGNFMCREYKPIRIRTFDVKDISAVRDYSESAYAE